MALNTTGGPTWTLNNLDSNIIVNATANEFLKQPTYYALGHFAKFVKPGSKRIGVSTNYGPLGNVTTVAFRRPDDYNVLIIYNGYNYYLACLLKYFFHETLFIGTIEILCWI